MKKTLLIALLLVVCAVAFCGPLGLEMGWKEEDFKKAGIELVDGVTYSNITSYSVELPLEEYAFIVVRLDSIEGLYEIEAVTQTIETAEDGTEMVAAFDAKVATLNAQYGKGKVYNALSENSTFTEETSFMFALTAKERTVIGFWDAESTHNLWVGLQAIGLSSKLGCIQVTWQSPKADSILERFYASGENS